MDYGGHELVIKQLQALQFVSWETHMVYIKKDFQHYQSQTKVQKHRFHE